VKAHWSDTKVVDGKHVPGDKKTIDLPFEQVTVRALIVRRSDRAVLGALHRPDGCYALPGGSIKNRENPQDALLRELEEEGIAMIGGDEGWRERLAVDYFRGYNQLSLWYLFLVNDVSVTPMDELLQVGWITPDQDPWYPNQRARIQSWINEYLGDL
jgi:hypothetical protein